MMRKFFLASQVIFLCSISFAQKSIDGLINAEKSFAAYSVAHGTKEAFLKFADSAGIVFDQGKAVNAIEVWTKREKRPGVLNWRPYLVEISSSNDFGYTTGPWEFKLNDSIVARGQFVTVWHINSNGEWKFLADLGTGNLPIVSKIKLSKITAKKIVGPSSPDSLLNVEQQFINTYKENKSTAYFKYLSKHSVLKRNGQFDSGGKLKQSETIMQTPSAIEFTIIGSGIASSGDLAYVYGNTAINNKQENFLHIWRNEKNGWKIALEVLRY